MRGWISVLGAVLLAGCQTTSDVGEGPLVPSYRVTLAYENFKKLDTPGYFAVSPDGAIYGYSYCKDFNCRGHSPSVALGDCNSKRPKNDCLLYAYRDQLLWRFPAEWAPPEGFSYAMAKDTLPGVLLEARLWSHPDPLPGMLYAAPALSYGGFELTGTPRLGNCQGVMYRTHDDGGQWSAQCATGEDISGLFRLDVSGETVWGYTVVLDGDHLRFSARLAGATARLQNDPGGQRDVKPDGGMIGEGSLNLSPKVAAAFEIYKELARPTFFAVSPDGSNYGYSYCRKADCEAVHPGIALDECNRNRVPPDCKVYAREDEVIWRLPPKDLERANRGVGSARIGEGPIELSPGVKRGFETWLAEPAPDYFAVSTDGRNYGYSYCKNQGCRPQNWQKQLALAHCREYVRQSKKTDVDCRIYGERGKVVWKFQDE